MNPNTFVKECASRVKAAKTTKPLRNTEGFTLSHFFLYICLMKTIHLLAYLPFPRIPISSTSKMRVAPAGIKLPAPRLP